MIMMAFRRNRSQSSHILLIHYYPAITDGLWRGIKFFLTVVYI